MIDGLKPYPAYKNSGVPWLGQIPTHWEITPLKHCVRMNAAVLPETTDPNYEFRYLDIGSVGTGILTQRPQRVRFRNAPSRARRVVRMGDTIVSTVRTYLKAIYYVAGEESDLICSTGFAVLTPREGTLPEFVSYLAQSSPFTDRVTAESVGIAYPAITETQLGSFHVALPPLPEQAAIVRFFDHADRRIRRFIRAKKKLITLLNEQKQAIIHQAVTRGLDPNVKLKPSGVKWLGDVPEHWNVMPIKRAFLSLDYGISDSSTDNGTIRLLTMGNIKDGQVTIPDAGGVATVEDSLLLLPNDLLFNRTNSSELVGKVGLFRGANSPVTFASYLVRMRPRADFDAEYLNVALNGRSVLSIARREAIPSLHQSNLNPTRYGRLQFALPPLDEQRTILQALNAETSNIARVITATQREIAILQEYRTRLIADVVTGKLDVREAAANLPDEAEEQELVEEAEDFAENAEELEGANFEEAPAEVGV